LLIIAYSFDLLVWPRLVAADVRWPLCTIGFTMTALQRRAPHVGTRGAAPTLRLPPHACARVCRARAPVCRPRAFSRIGWCIAAAASVAEPVQG
jgi:hypothetical protein